MSEIVTIRFVKDELPDEPAEGSVILDDQGDAWQRRYDGWYCAIDGDYYTKFSWARMVREFTPLTVIHEESEESEAA